MGKDRALAGSANCTEDEAIAACSTAEAGPDTAIKARPATPKTVAMVFWLSKPMGIGWNTSERNFGDFVTDESWVFLGLGKGRNFEEEKKDRTAMAVFF